MGVIDKKSIFKAKQQLNDFLKENPHLQKMQEDIEKALEKAGKDSNNRITILHEMLMASVRELHKHLNDLTGHLKKFTPDEEDKENTEE